MRMKWLYIGLLATGLSTTVLAGSGVMIRDETVRATASASATGVTSVRKGSQVEILAKQGGWTQIRYAGRTGWVRLLSVRSGTPSRPDAAADIAGVAAIGQTRSQPGKVVAVAGLRGLKEEELRTAHYDAEAMKKLDGYAVSRGEAERFAAQGGLVKRQLAYLPAPKTNGGSSGNAFPSPWGGN